MIEIYIESISCIEDKDIPKLGMSLLCCERKEHMESFRRIDDKKRTLLASILLENYLRDKFGIKETYSIGYKENGKPYINELPNFYFNISHSDEFVMFVASDDEIGADIQVQKELTDAMVSRITAPGEKCDNPIRTWCAKESYIKYTGRGIAEDMRTFSIDFETDTVRDLNGNIKASLGNILLENKNFYAYICMRQKAEYKVFVNNQLALNEYIDKIC